MKHIWRSPWLDESGTNGCNNDNKTLSNNVIACIYSWVNLRNDDVKKKKET